MIKLVLYSDQILLETEKVDRELIALVGKSNPTIGYIPSSAKADPQRKYYDERRAYYARLGMTLSPFFGLDEAYEPSQLKELFGCDAIHFSGGNTYYFLHWLQKRNMFAAIRQYTEKGGVLIGVSAGAILMTPNITTASLCGDEPLDAEIDLAALHLVDFAFVPHFGNGHSDLATLQTYSRDRQVVLYACRDGEGIIVRDEQVECVGDVTIIVNGENVSTN